MAYLGDFFSIIGSYADQIAALTKSFGPFGVIVFMLLYVGIVISFLPITPFSLAAGAIYGWWGIPIAFASANLGALLSFLIARGAGRNYIQRVIRRRPLAAVIDRCVLRGGWRLVLLIRLSGVLPFAVQNYSFGLTGLKVRPYVTATLIGLIPGTFVKAWIGKSGVDVLSDDRPSSYIEVASLVAALIITLTMLGYIGRLAYRELKRAGMIENGETTER
ncbi:MAG: TVP38/TMEM64 family protein [Pseudomonadota bacterium]